MTARQAAVADPTLSVICVTYQSRPHVVKSLRSTVRSAEAAGVSVELIVVDNASTDGSADAANDAFPDAVILRNDTNRGFGAANNQAFGIARGAAWLLVNPDARLYAPAVAGLLAALGADPGLAAVGPSISGAGVGRAESGGMLPGIRSMAGHFLFLNRLLPRDVGGPWRGWMVRRSRGTAIRSVEWVSGAVVLLRPTAVREIGGFDESIFLYGEDTDLCARLVDRGWRVGLAPAARAWHAIGGSQAPGSTRWVDGLEQFLVRAGRSRLSRFVCLLSMAVGLAVRVAARPGKKDDRGDADPLRMRAAAWRALAVSISTVLGRSQRPSH
jgi:N-acetylglucosaminyl-diphospho-decaprenol L-rhamnosyltransferase